MLATGRLRSSLRSRWRRAFSQRSSSWTPANLLVENADASKSISAFAEHAADYDRYFDNAYFAENVYKCEVRAVQRSLETALKLDLKSQNVNLLEIGIGSGRFALPLKQARPRLQVFGLEPADPLAALCRKRFAEKGLELAAPLLDLTAEELPGDAFGNEAMDCALLVTVIGFLRDHRLALRNLRRCLAANGVVVVAFIDGGTKWGAEFAQATRQGRFYQHGHCVLGVPQLVELFEAEGFRRLPAADFQALVDPDADDEYEDDPNQEGLAASLAKAAEKEKEAIPGHGKGAWAVCAFEVAE